MSVNNVYNEVDTVGERLKQARLARGLDVDEVAELTRIRPERIVDLEADRYGNFPNLAYAKSFLTKYALFLGVDIHHYLEHFQLSRSISLGEYQYLASATAHRSSGERTRITPRGFRVPPLVVIVLVLIVLVGIPLFSYFSINVSRLKSKVDTEDAAPLANALPMPSVAPSPTDSLRSTAIVPQVKPQETGDPSMGSLADQQQSGPTPYASRSHDVRDGVEVRRAMPADSALSNGEPPPKPEATPLLDKKLEVRLLKRTWVRVTRDAEGSQPVYEGFVGPDSKPIYVVGKRFWVRVLDKDAVEVKKDGQLVLSSSDDIVIN